MRSGQGLYPTKVFTHASFYLVGTGHIFNVAQRALHGMLSFHCREVCMSQHAN